MSKLVIIRHGGIPSPAFWNERLGEWVPNGATLFDEGEELEKKAFFFGVQYMNERKWRDTNNRIFAAQPTVEIVTVEEATCRYGTITTESPP